MSGLGKRLIASLKDTTDNPNGIKQHKISYALDHLCGDKSKGIEHIYPDDKTKSS